MIRIEQIDTVLDDQVMAALRGDGEVRAVILKGAALGTRAELVAGLGKPVIAAIEGPISRELALACTLRVATEAAAGALESGLVDQVVADRAELDAVCAALGAQICRNAPLAIKYTLEAVDGGCGLPLASGLRLESALFALCLATDDAGEGARAFLEKRPPKFRGR